MDPFGTHRRGWWFVFSLPFMLAFMAVAGLVLMLLWNSLLPIIFGIKAIGYWQAVGLLILSKVLFGGIGRRPKYSYDPRYHWRRWHEGEFEASSTEKPKQ
ncbi:MAG: hypothetical protein M1470_14790 [Bacteroidetes bacterium]|nr:hypothetical protein [Bacteroidota bacterium]MCL5737936.1 hypothetical protein [Bacteroidota bacterium]